MRRNSKKTAQAKQMLENAKIISTPHNLPTDIPDTFRGFYKDLGGILHDQKTDKFGNPFVVKELAEYQYEFAEQKYAIWLKSNKIGATTGESLNDFYSMIKPHGLAGKMCILQASTDTIAIELLRKMCNNIRNSVKYAPFIDERNTSATKVTIHNPYNPVFPSEIIAIGQSLTNVYSRMQVGRIHISDPAMLTITSGQNDLFAGLFSRLANTNGDIKIEGVPGPNRSGWFWEMCKVLFDQYEDDAYDQNQTIGEQFIDEREGFVIPLAIRKHFYTMVTTIDDAVKADVISADFRQLLKDSLPDQQYRRIAMGEWAETEGAIFRGPISEGDYDPQKW